jgi:predicted transcriptional regulator
MTLDQWLTKHEIRNEDFAQRIGIGTVGCWRLRKGHTQPKWETIEAIVRETKGQVMPNDFLPSTVLNRSQRRAARAEARTSASDKQGGAP